MKDNPKDWAEFPWQKAIIILLGAASALFGLIIKAQKDSLSNRDEVIIYIRKLNKDLKDDIKVKDSLIYSCKDIQSQYWRKQDSTNRAILDVPAKELLKQLKK